MATDKKHIAVYLSPEIEQALIAFCEQKGLISKKGTMYSAGVNAALAEFFGIADIDNILQSSSNIPTMISTISDPTASNIPNNATSNTPARSIDVEVLPGKPEGLSDGETDSLRQELEAVRAENQRWEEAFNELQGEKDDLDTYLQEARSQIEALKAENEALKAENEALKAENEALRTAQPATEFELPEPADLLNQLKAKRKKATASLADIETILKILEGR
jgi:regulator of replication initiation timing